MKNEHLYKAISFLVFILFIIPILADNCLETCKTVYYGANTCSLCASKCQWGYSIDSC